MRKGRNDYHAKEVVTSLLFHDLRDEWFSLDPGRRRQPVPHARESTAAASPAPAWAGQRTQNTQSAASPARAFFRLFPARLTHAAKTAKCT